MNPVDSFHACVAMKKFYDANGYPDTGTVLTMRGCGNDLFGVFLVICLVVFIMYKLHRKYCIRCNVVKK